MLISFLTTTRQHPLFVVLAAGLVAIEALARIWGGPPPSLALVRNPFAAIAAATIFCRYVIVDRRGPARRWIVYLTPATFALAVAVEGRDAPMQLLLLDVLCALGGLGLLGFVVAIAVAGTEENRDHYVHQLLTALIIPMAASMASFGLWSTHRLNPVYDGRVYAFEEILGVRFSLLGVRSYELIPFLSAIATGCYGILPLALALVAAFQKDLRTEHDVLAATAFAGACGFALYFFCPVAGPLHAFRPWYPAGLPAIEAASPLITAPIGVPRNGMPSLHTTWALLLWFNLRSLHAMWRWSTRLFVVLTLWAVMGLDDTHWFLDVVVAVPFAVALQLAFVPGRAEAASRRWADIGLCAALTVAWLAGLRSAFPLLAMPPVLAWTAVVATVWWPLSRERAALSDRRSNASEVAASEGTIESLPA